MLPPLEYCPVFFYLGFIPRGISLSSLSITSLLHSLGTASPHSYLIIHSGMSDFSTVLSRMLDESNNIISILRFLSSYIINEPVLTGQSWTIGGHNPSSTCPKTDTTIHLSVSWNTA